MWFKVIAPAICYLLFHWEFFRCAESILPVKPLRKRTMAWTSVLNYGVFYLCSVLQIHLVFNWIIFLFLLLAEQKLLYRQPVRNCFLLAILGTQFGLTANIFFRSLVAVLLDMPLVAFDSNTTSAGNMKYYPVLLGFLAAGAAFLLAAHFDLLKKLVLVTENKGILAFTFCLLIAMYAYLCMNLMVYYIKDNNLILKLWSMKSALFVAMGESLSVILAIRLGELADYRAKNQASKELMAREQARELELRIIAATDPLTGCENRYGAKTRLQDALDSGRPFCLCFVDLNRLKAVNDNFGHEMGDNYLIAVARALGQLCGEDDLLFRYGGDEFLLLLFDREKSDAAALLEQVQRRLGDPELYAYPFPISISYGIATPADSREALGLIEAADARMYEMKSAKRQDC